MIARVRVLSSEGCDHVVRVLSGDLPQWLTENRGTLVPTMRLAEGLYRVDGDELGEAEERGEIEIEPAKAT